PGILEPILLKDEPTGARRDGCATRIVSLESFESERTEEGRPSRVEQWLERWNRLAGRVVPISLDDLAARDIVEMGRTPVLLFVIVFGWDEGSNSTGMPRPALYERFMRRIARGKLPESGESHEPQQKAAQELASHLIATRHVPPETSHEEALLWALSLIAWEAHGWEQRLDVQPFTRRDVEKIILDRLGCRRLGEHLSAVVVDGILLALQHSPRRGETRILYGHKSFREYLVARFWNAQLRKIVMARHRNPEWEPLQGALLDVDQDQAKN